MFDRLFSVALFTILWCAGGFVFGAVWYAAFGAQPEGWVRWSGMVVLFCASIPLEAALERRYQRRKADQPEAARVRAKEAGR